MKYKRPYTLYKRGEYWYYRAYDAMGKRTAGTSTGETSKSKAMAYCDKLFKQGRLIQAKDNLLEYATSMFAEGSEYIKDKRSVKGITERTISTYRYMLPSLLPLGKLAIAELTYTKLQAFRNVLIKRKLANGTINNYMRILHTVIVRAIRDGIIDRDPFIGLESLKVPIRLRDAITIAELKVALSRIHKEAYNYVLLLALTGMRANEAIGVTASDIHSEDGVDYILLDKQRIEGEYCPLKTKDSRVIPINATLLQLFKEGLAFSLSCAWYRLRFRESIVDFKDKEARKLSLHSLRHFFITQAKSYGISPLKVRAIAGHRIEKGVEAIYTNFKALDLKDIIVWQDYIVDAIHRS